MIAVTRRLNHLGFLLLLVLAFACNWSVKCRLSNAGSLAGNSFVQQFVPERLRSFAAAYLWSRAEQIMHRGPLPQLAQSFQAGSFGGNTDIIPLLQMVIMLMPEELPPYQLLASNLSRYLGEPLAGLRIIQEGIINNPDHPAIHELYAAAAFLKIFAIKADDDIRRSALKYLLRAFQSWHGESAAFSSDPAFKPQNYAILQSRLLLELSRPDEALAAWNLSGLSLDTANDRLAILLRDYRDHKKIPTPEDLNNHREESESTAGAAITANPQESAGVVPLLPMMHLLTGAGFLLIIVSFMKHYSSLRQ